jgi:hypothetical protein
MLFFMVVSSVARRNMTQSLGVLQGSVVAAIVPRASGAPACSFVPVALYIHDISPLLPPAPLCVGIEAVSLSFYQVKNMRQITKFLALALGLLLPLVCQAQQAAQVECSRQDGFIYLYSSVTTLEIGGKLKCGQQVRVLARYDTFLQVRTEDGQTGFVPASTVRYVKATPEAKASTRSKGKQVSAAAHKEESAPAPPREITLTNQTPVRVKLGRSVSSASAHSGEEVNFEVVQDVVVSGLIVIPKGAPAVGVVTEAEPKRRMGRGGKLSISVNYVRLGENQKVALHSYQDDKGADQKVGMVIPLMHGKDITLAQDTEMTAYVSGDVHVKASGLAAAHASSGATTVSQSSSAPPQN